MARNVYFDTKLSVHDTMHTCCPPGTVLCVMFKYCNCKNECMSRYGLKCKWEGASTHLELLRLITCNYKWLQESAECSPVQVIFNTTFTTPINHGADPVLEPNRFSASAKTPLIFWYPYVQYRVHNSSSFPP